MKNQVKKEVVSNKEKQPKAKKHQLFIDEKLIIEDNSHEEILKQIEALQTQNKPKFIHLNHVAKSCHVYSKSRHDMNYSVTSGEYEIPKKKVLEA